MTAFNTPLSQKIWGRIEKTDSCWLWTAGTNDGGYGRVYNNGRNEAAHRAVYEMLVGPIPEGLQLDHLCRVRLCVNPAHMEPVTPRENVLRGDTFTAANVLKTHCPQGHEYNEENTYTYHRSRHCRQCSVERTRQWRHAHEAVGRPS